MISQSTLISLSNQKKLDATVLRKEGRHSGAVYLMGYSIELALKRKICHTLNFVSGFPDRTSDFALYSHQIAAFNAISTGVRLTKLREIRNHDLNVLLTYSGAESRIKANFLSEWQIVEKWNPEDRYVLRRYSSDKVTDFLNAATTIVNEIS